MSGSFAARLSAFALFLSVFCGATLAGAQGFGGPGGGGMPGGGFGGGAPPQQQKKKKKEAPPPGTPEMHAASGGDDSLSAPGSEPSLPDEPLKLKQSQFDTIGSDNEPDQVELGRNPHSTTFSFYGPYMTEKSDKYQFS